MWWSCLQLTKSPTVWHEGWTLKKKKQTESIHQTTIKIESFWFTYLDLIIVLHIDNGCSCSLFSMCYFNWRKIIRCVYMWVSKSRWLLIDDKLKWHFFLLMCFFLDLFIIFLYVLFFSALKSVILLHSNLEMGKSVNDFFWYFDWYPIIYWFMLILSASDFWYFLEI